MKHLSIAVIIYILIFYFTVFIKGVVDSGHVILTDCGKSPSRFSYYTGIHHTYEYGCYLGKPMENLK